MHLDFRSPRGTKLCFGSSLGEQGPLCKLVSGREDKIQINNRKTNVDQKSFNFVAEKNEGKSLLKTDFLRPQKAAKSDPTKRNF